MATLSDLLALKASEGFQDSFQKAKQRNADTAAAEALAGTNAKAAQAKNLADLFKSKQEADQNIARDGAAQDHAVQTAGKLYGIDTSTPEGIKSVGDRLAAGGGSVGKDSLTLRAPVDPLTRQHRADERYSSKERALASKEYSGLYKGATDQSATVQFMHDLLSTPADQQNSYIDKYMSINKARLGEGQGQRLLQSVIQTFGGDPSLYGDIEKAKNYILSRSNSKVSPQERLQLVDSINPSLQHINDELETSDNTIRSKHGIQYPHLGDPENWVKAEGGTTRANYGKLSSKQKELHDRFSAEAKTAPGPLKQMFSGVFSNSSKPAEGPHGPSVEQDGKTYTWDPVSKSYK